jgi:hypothetical protein
MPEHHPRPLKRARLVSDSSSSSPPPTKSSLSPIPTPILLLSLPRLLLQPPNHPQHVLSLSLSLCAIRKCLEIDGLDSDIECRAWTAFAELASLVISGGFHRNPDEHPWAQGVETEVCNLLFHAFSCHLIAFMTSNRQIRPSAKA